MFIVETEQKSNIVCNSIGINILYIIFFLFSFLFFFKSAILARPKNEPIIIPSAAWAGIEIIPLIIAVPIMLLDPVTYRMFSNVAKPKETNTLYTIMSYNSSNSLLLYAIA